MQENESRQENVRNELFSLITKVQQTFPPPFVGA